MEKQNQAQDGGRAGGDHRGEREPVAAVRHPFAEPAAPDVRLAQPMVAGDGQIVEAGYGHGV
jgi:hypothetical protein